MYFLAWITGTRILKYIAIFRIYSEFDHIFVKPSHQCCWENELLYSERKASDLSEVNQKHNRIILYSADIATWARFFIVHGDRH
jgi:hypothetical protein